MPSKCEFQPSWRWFRTTFELPEMRGGYNTLAILNMNELSGHVDFTDYLTVYHWIRDHVYESECGCGSDRCPECKLHRTEYFNLETSMRNYYALFSPSGVLKSNYKRQLGPKLAKLVYSFDFTPDEEYMMRCYTTKELKCLVKANFSPQVFSQKRKYFWLKAFISTEPWSFNAFALKTLKSGTLNKDVVMYIQGYLTKDVAWDRQYDCGSMETIKSRHCPWH